MQLRLLSNEALHSDLQTTCADQRKGMAEILRYLIEVDRRTLYAAMGYRSLFAYCLKELKMSENEAGPRVAVARLAKEYSWVLEALAEGDIHLTGLFRLSAHMRPSNCLDLLGEARGKTVKEIDDLLAKHFPKPDVPELLRALPLRATASTTPTSVEPPKKSSAAERTIPMFDERVLGSPSDGVSAASAAASAAAPAAAFAAAPAVVFATVATPVTPATPAPAPCTDQGTLARELGSTLVAPPSPSLVAGEIARSDLLDQPSQPPQSAQPAEGDPPSSMGASRPRKEKLTPLSESRHALQLTISAEIRQMLERARELMSHRHRDGSFEAIVGAALKVLLEKLERERLGKTKRTRQARTPSVAPAAAATAEQPVLAGEKSFDCSLQTSHEASPSSAGPTNGPARSKALPRAVRRAVFERDGEQCSFVSEAGVRCDARSFLEIDHIHPKALGGEDTAANTRLLCATHNRLAAERVFGRDHVHRKIRESRWARRQKQSQRQ